MKKILLTFVLLLFIPFIASAESDWSLIDAFQIKWVGNVRPSPDASRIIYQTISTNILSNRWHSQIYIAEKNAITQRLKSRFLGDGEDPKWSPDGEWISYISEPGNQLIVIKPDPKPRYFVYHIPSRPKLYAWSPDMSKIALVLPNLLELKRKSSLSYNYATHSTNNRLYWIATYFEKKQDMKGFALTDPKINIAADNISWTPDSQDILFSEQASPQASDSDIAKVAEINLNSKKVTLITNKASYNHNPFVSPDGKWVAFESNRAFLAGKNNLSTNLTEAYHTLIQICLAPLNHKIMTGDSIHCLQPIFSHNASLLGWDENNQSVYVSADNKTILSLYKINVQSGVIKNISQDKLVREPHLNHSGTYVGFTSENLTTPPEAFFAKLSDSINPEQVSAQNKIEKPLPKVEIIKWKGVENAEIEGILVYPANYQQDKKYPLLVVAHGGPTNHWWQFFVGAPYTFDTPICFACVSSKGYFVLAPNPHGSTGYGKAFLLSNFKRLGEIDYKDIIDGVNELINRHLVDKNNINIWGWSYGGYLSAWSPTQTTLFKKAIVGAGISDMVSLNGTSIYRTLPYYLGSYFWNDNALWVNRSPVFFANHIKNTKIFIQACDDDKQVPLSQSQELYYALSKNHVPVTWMVYEHEGHSFDNPVSLMAASADALKFLN